MGHAAINGRPVGGDAVADRDGGDGPDAAQDQVQRKAVATQGSGL